MSDKPKFNIPSELATPIEGFLIDLQILVLKAIGKYHKIENIALTDDIDKIREVAIKLAPHLASEIDGLISQDKETDKRTLLNNICHLINPEFSTRAQMLNHFRV